ncbi:MAG TPA: hypothetical protein VM537_17765 [Anaerolineae bacterium]|nr:hypothetical protein [Anaerolineae bacterium]
MADAERLVRVLVDRRPTNMRVGEKGAPKYYADVVMCVDAGRGYVFCSEALSPEDGDEAVVAAAQQTLAKIQASVLRGRVTWVARQDGIARVLAAEFGGPTVVLDSGDSFAPWDEAYLAMDRDLAGAGTMVGYLWRRDVEPEDVAELFEAAARFYRLRPWQFLADSEFLEKPSLVPGEPPLLISVMGASGISRGLALFDSPEDFEAMMSDRGHDGVVYASFERRDRMPHTMVTEAEEHGWTMASKSAFPMVVRVREEMPIPCASDDLRRVTAAFRALNEVTSAYRESRRSRRRT